MILKLIIILVILYYLLLLLWFGKNQKDIKPINKTTPKRARSIIGKSTYIVTIPLEADQTTPQNYAEPMQVDFEIEYDDGSIIKLLGKVNLQGEVKIENVKLNQKQESK